MMPVDWTPLTEEQKQLAENNVRLAWFTVKRYLGRIKRLVRDEEKDTLDAEALLGLCRATRSYDPKRGVQFSTYAVNYIYWWIRRYQHRERLKRLPSLITVPEITGRTRPHTIEQEEALLALINHLPDKRSREALRLRFLEEKTFKEIGKVLSVSASRAQQIIKTNLQRLRHTLTRGEYGQQLPFRRRQLPPDERHRKPQDQQRPRGEEEGRHPPHGPGRQHHQQ